MRNVSETALRSSDRQGFSYLRDVLDYFSPMQLDSEGFPYRSNYVTGLFLLQKIFKGDMCFYVPHPDGNLKKYSFKKCYEMFIRSLEGENDIYFDTLSPQYLPRLNDTPIDEKSMKYGVFYNFSSDPNFHLDKDQWEFRLKSDVKKAYGLKSLGNLPSARKLQDEAGTLYVNDTSVLDGIDPIATINSRNFSDSYFGLPSFVHTEKVFCHPAYLNSGKMMLYKDNSKIIRKVVTRGYFNIDNFRMLNRENNVCKIAFMGESDRVFMLSAQESHAYDCKFSIYFEEVNKIIKNSNFLYGNFSYLFYIFLKSFGLDINNRLSKRGSGDAESYNKSKCFASVLIRNSFLSAKIIKDVLNEIINPISVYSGSCDVFYFLSNIYLSRSVVLELIECLNDIDGFYKNEIIEFHSSISSKNKNPKQLFPAGKTVDDVLNYLIYKSCERDDNVVYCLSALSLYYNDEKTKNEILEKFFPNEYLSKEKIERISQKIHNRIAARLKKIL